MRRFIALVALCGLAPLSAQALELLDVSRAVRLVDPGNNFFVFDQRSSSTGGFQAAAQSRDNKSSQASMFTATPESITLDLSAAQPSLYATLNVGAVSDQVIAETWIRMAFRADGPSAISSAQFFAQTSGGFDADVQVSLLDLTTGDPVFRFDTSSFRGRRLSWAGELAPGHTYGFDYTVVAFGRDGHLFTNLDFAITAQPVPEPATALLLLAGLAAAGLRRPRLTGATPAAAS